MKTDLKKIFSIILVTVTISLVYNHFNENGLPLLRSERILVWESDSLSLGEQIDSTNHDSVLPDNKKDSVSENTTNNKQIIDAFNQPKAINLSLAYKLFKEGIQFIDARPPEEYNEGHIKGALNIPFYGSENYLKTINSLDKNKLIVTYCSGADCDISTLSGDELFSMGFKKVYVFVGGFEEWVKNKYPITKN